MRRIGTLAGTVLFLLTGSLSSAAQQADDVAVPPEVRSLVDDWMASYEALDAAGVASFYASEGTHITDWGAEVTGPDDIRALYENVFALFDSIGLEVRFTDFQQAEGWAFGRVLITRGGKLRDGRSGTSERHHAFSMRQTEEGWKIAWDVSGPRVGEPPPGF